MVSGRIDLAAGRGFPEPLAGRPMASLRLSRGAVHAFLAPANVCELELRLGEALHATARAVVERELLLAADESEAESEP